MEKNIEDILLAYKNDEINIDEAIKKISSCNLNDDIIGIAESLWDKYSEGIGSDIHDLDFWAGQTVMERRNFIQAIENLFNGNN